MKKIRQRWQHLAERVDALSLRERVLIFAVAALTVLTLVNTLVIDPLLARQRALSQEAAQTQTKIRALQAQVQDLASAQSTDPDAPLRKRLAQLQQELAGADTALLDFQSGLVGPQQMPALLQDILQRNRALKLVSLRNLPMQSLTTAVEQAATEAAPRAASAPPPAQQPALYRHGVEITVEGGYWDLLHYLTAMESSPWRMFWGRAELKSDTYPKATLTLTLYTLSLDKAWLTI